MAANAQSTTVANDTADAGRPLHISFPSGRIVRLPKRGDGFVRIDEAPSGAPTLLLLHGWTATADINWATAYETLTPHYGLIAPDLHGHGRGPRRRRRFRLKECADDVAALADYLGIEKLIVVGYSMGGTVAQMLWRHHPELVDGMVLCATAGMFRESLHEFFRFSGLGLVALAAAVLPRSLARWVRGRMLEERSKQGMSEWALSEMYRHDPLRLLQAGREIGIFDTRTWLSSVDVPVASVITTQDEVVAPERQRELARLIKAQDVFEIEGGHAVCVRSTVEWPETLRASVDAVVARVNPDETKRRSERQECGPQSASYKSANRKVIDKNP